MKRIPLTKGKYALVDDNDYETLAKYRWHFNSRGYATRMEYLGKIKGKYKSKTVCMHSQIMNTPSGMDTDHINGDRIDNRRSNLRICTRGQNIMNSLQRGKYTGVTLFNNKARGWSRYSARITTNGKCMFLGYYKTARQAAEAYNKAALEYHGEFAKLNVLETA